MVSKKITLTITHYEAAALDRAIFEAVYIDQHDVGALKWDQQSVRAVRRVQEKIYEEMKKNGR